ncbi:unannotated protein [freshwater metagenome]|uniref:Unannotated protein n=1 Tax=freshwater metagenome TaxID=449393 RepID=A0A6J7L8A5_9ZZZZ|nr:hypothetical protein [Actinomycetota bacterium]
MAERNDRGGKPRREGPAGRSDRGDRARPARDSRDGAPERPAWQTRVTPKVRSDKPKSPPIPEEITPADLLMPIRVQLKTLSVENAEMTARHLAMVDLLIEQDPALAHQHAVAAAARAGRIPVVRETLGITAYRTGDFALALRELLTHRRMTASNDQLPLIVDSERGLGRPERALELARSVDKATLSPTVRVNLAIATSGARLDLGQNDLALAELEIKELDSSRVFEYSPPLFWAYADTLEALGRETEAKKWSALAERAEKAVSPEATGEDEELSIIEEIVIPSMKDWKARD